MTALLALVPQLKRFVATPGGFTATFPSATNSELVGSLADAFGAAQLRGFFSSSTWALTFNDEDNSATTADPDLNLAQRALLVLFAGIQILENEIRNRNARVKYVAGPVSYEVDSQGASVMTELLKKYSAEKEALISDVAASGAGDFIHMEDMAYTKGLFGDWRYSDLDWSSPGDLS